MELAREGLEAFLRDASYLILRFRQLVEAVLDRPRQVLDLVGYLPETVGHRRESSGVDPVHLLQIGVDSFEPGDIDTGVLHQVVVQTDQVFVRRVVLAELQVADVRWDGKAGGHGGTLL